MKSALISSIAATLVLLSVPGWAGTFTVLPLTGDADSGISANDAFTHAIDIDAIPTNNNTSVNGAVFSSSFGGNPGVTSFIAPGTNNYSTSEMPNTLGNNPQNVFGSIGSLLQNFNYGGSNPETLTLNNLRVGQQYTTSFYSDAYGSPGGRVVDFTTSDGGSLSSFDQNQGGTRLTYTFTAASTALTFTITPRTSDSFHQYAFTNRMDGYQSLLTDNFRAPSSSSDVNFNLAARQGGSLVATGGPISYIETGDGNGGQVGNDTGYNGQPYGGDYLLNAFGTRTTLDHNFRGAESAGGLSVSFDFAPNITNNGDTTNWEAICLGMSDGDKTGSVNNGAAHFGILFRGNGGIQAFDGGSVVSGAETWGAGATNLMHHVELLLTDPTDLNPFDGVGETDIAAYVDGLLVYSYVKGGGGYTDDFVNFSDSFIGGADNVMIAQVSPVPEPTAFAMLALGSLALARRHRRSGC